MSSKKAAKKLKKKQKKKTQTGKMAPHDLLDAAQPLDAWLAAAAQRAEARRLETGDDRDRQARDLYAAAAKLAARPKPGGPLLNILYFYGGYASLRGGV